jgi:hypothetical protein
MSACSRPNEDARELSRLLITSELEPRTFEYTALSPDVFYTVRGEVEDDFRIEMVLSRAGRDLLEYVVHDDLLAMRIADASVVDDAGPLGHPTVDAALRAGEWVVDPSGAPPLVRTETGPASESSGDPFRDAREGLRFVTRSLGQAFGVREFSLESIDYRPAFDPWRYPTGESEKRYDLIRSPIPKNEGQTQGGGDVSAAHFRKTSVFVKGSRVDQVCSLIDIEGHEEYVALKERGFDSNPFLDALFKRVKEGQTAIPIEQREVFLEVSYPDEVKVGVPQGVTGKLTSFVNGVNEAVAEGALKPDGERLKECHRPAKTDG